MQATFTLLALVLLLTFGTNAALTRAPISHRASCSFCKAYAPGLPVDVAELKRVDTFGLYDEPVAAVLNSLVSSVVPSPDSMVLCTPNVIFVGQNH